MAKKPPKPEGIKSNPRTKGGKGHGREKPLPHDRLGALTSARFLSEMDSGPDRAAAIIAAGLVENNLALMLLSRFHPLSDPEQRAIFQGESAFLGNFSSKIELGYVLFCYDLPVKQDLVRLRKIRNKFAHLLTVSSFDHAEVRDYCDSLVHPAFLAWAEGKAETKDRRARVLDTAAHLAARFDMESRNIARPPAPAVIPLESYLVGRPT